MHKGPWVCDLTVTSSILNFFDYLIIIIIIYNNNNNKSENNNDNNIHENITWFWLAESCVTPVQNV